MQNKVYRIHQGFARVEDIVHYHHRLVGPTGGLHTGADASFPVENVTFSPDGLWLAFESWPDGRNHDIFVMDTDGKNLIRLTTDPDFDFDPTWRITTP